MDLADAVAAIRPTDSLAVPLVHVLRHAGKHEPDDDEPGDDVRPGAGLGRRLPRHELGHLDARIFRAARIVVDTSLHIGDMSFEEAVRFMSTKAGLSEPTARAAPGCPASAATSPYVRTSPGRVARSTVRTDASKDVMAAAYLARAPRVSTLRPC